MYVSLRCKNDLTSIILIRTWENDLKHLDCNETKLPNRSINSLLSREKRVVFFSWICDINFTSAFQLKQREDTYAKFLNTSLRVTGKCVKICAVFNNGSLNSFFTYVTFGFAFFFWIHLLMIFFTFSSSALPFYWILPRRPLFWLSLSGSSWKSFAHCLSERV